MKSVIIIEDNDEHREVLDSIITSQLGLKTFLYASAEDFFNSKFKHANCVYLIDWNLPGVQGPDIIKKIRVEDKISPIFMISGNFDPELQEEGIESGADVYITKPYTPGFLVKSIIQAQKKHAAIEKDSLTKGIKAIEESGLVLKDGKPASLTPREFKIFKYLFDDMEKVWKREELFILMGGENDTAGRKIDVIISHVRKKISEIGLEIETVRGEGYQLREL